MSPKLLRRPRERKSTRPIALALVSIPLLLLSIFPTGLMSTVAALGPHQATLTEWTVPTPKSGIRALRLDKSGSCCWFLEYYSNQLGHLDPATNTFQEWTMPSGDANPYGLAITSNPVSPELWGTEFGSDRIFAFSPRTGTIRDYTIRHGNTGIGDVSIEQSGSQVRIWFTETIENVNGELIYDPSSGNATLYEDYFPVSMGGGAFGVYAQSNSVWFVGFSALLRWDRATQQYTSWSLPNHGAVIGRSIIIDSYGQAWYTQGTRNATSNDNFVGVLRSNGIIEEWRLPNLGADPQTITINPQSQQPLVAERSLDAANGAIGVLSDSRNPNLVPVTPSTVPSGGTASVLAPKLNNLTLTTSVATPNITRLDGIASGSFLQFPVGKSAPQDVVADSQGNIWFSEPGTNRIAELSGFTPDFALTSSPFTMSLPQGSSETVTIVGSAISSYQGSITVTPSNLPEGVSIPGGAHTLTIPQGAENASVRLPIDVSANATIGTSAIEFEGNDGTNVHTTSFLLTVTNNSAPPTEKPQCLVAMATYGSNLSPEVQFLRGYRDNLLRTKTGRSFLLLFNSWYYSFSPYIANHMRDDLSSREMVKGVIYPLIGSLALSSDVYSALSMSPECAALISGLMASCMIGVLYVGLPLSVIKRRLRCNLRLSVRLCAALLLCGLGGILVGLGVRSADLLMAASSLIVLSATCGSGALTAEIISDLTKPLNGSVTSAVGAFSSSLSNRVCFSNALGRLGCNHILLCMLSVSGSFRWKFSHHLVGGIRVCNLSRPTP